jgi:hypothetical protein
MQLFQCQHCGQALFFENTHCESCGRRLGYLPAEGLLTALEPDGAAWRSLAAGDVHGLCSNAAHDVCNWLIPAGSNEAFCAACRYNRTVPDLSLPENLASWRKLEQAKHRLFYTLLKLGLPLQTRQEDPEEGLAFDFLADPEGSDASQAVMTGHDHGLITISLAEAEDAERERRRSQMHEPYRTLLGHFRHEIAHYFWDRLVRDAPMLARCRAVFGDETRSYAEALQEHYDKGPPAGWQQSHVSAYAAAHPWEDFAETWAHYLHMVDTLETAHAFGLRVKPRIAGGEELSTRIDVDPHRASDIGELMEPWVPLTLAVNSINRSMGQPDLYPFVLSPRVIEKLGFIHDLVHAPREGSDLRQPQPAISVSTDS